MKDNLLQIILNAGATKAEVIPQSKIVLSSYFRDVCAGNQCGMYGKSHMCPPSIGDIDELMEKVRSFPTAILYQSIAEIEDSFDFEGMMEAGKKHEELCIRIHKDIKPIIKGNYLHLGSGGRHICEECAILRNEPCVFPEKTIAPVEGHGIDVSNTCKGTSLKYINGPDTVTYFGMILFEE